MAAVNVGLWNNLPSIIIVEIFSFLSLKDRLNASSVCRTWRECLFHPSLWYKAVFHINSFDNTVSHRGNESARFLANHCGRFVRNVVIEVNSLNPRDVKFCKEILDVLTYNSNLRALSLRPRSCRLEWLDSESNEEPIEQYIAALSHIIRKAHRLEHLSLGCVEEILDNAESLLVLLAQHQAKYLKSLHLSSVKEYPDHYALLEMPANMFDPFCNLQTLSIDYDNISDELLLVLSKPHKKALQHLNIHVHGIDSDNPGTSDLAWRMLCDHSPGLEVTITLLHSHDLSNYLHDILHPNMPLTHFRSYFSPGLDASFLDLIAALNNSTLQSLAIVESVSEDMMPTATFLTVDEDPLVMLAWRCKKLVSLKVIGYDICSADLIAISRLRGSQLKEFDVPSCCILVTNSDDDTHIFLDGANEEVYKYIVSEVSSSLGKAWTPMSIEDLPPSVCNLNMDADGTYLGQLLHDQKW